MKFGVAIIIIDHPRLIHFNFLVSEVDGWGVMLQ
jgi:hypothetical protein